MTRQEHLLTILGEECVEVAQRASKALRFGLTEVQPDLAQAYTNAERLMQEYAHLVAMIDMCQEEGLLPVMPQSFVAAKKRNVEKYLGYSRECGTLTP